MSTALRMLARARAEARSLHRVRRMTMETSAWLVAGIAGVSCGAIAGTQQHLTSGAVVAIFAVAAAAAVLVSRILPRHADPL